eukprot:TRINITY_DN29662_c0_g1_i1.p1 TRINITY_DN29662_c0_g1~~TRINITY_DN29662_c0_g1_i1.p1  ORF type:complete len:1047 (+),score=194.18 TRINITY_DN29662_c0_g1_i1:34-3174(+)
MPANAEDSDFDVNELLGELSDDCSDASSKPGVEVSQTVPRSAEVAFASKPPLAVGSDAAGEEAPVSPIETPCAAARTSLQSRLSIQSSQSSEQSSKASQASSGVSPASMLGEGEEEEEDVENLEEEEVDPENASDSGSSSAKSGSGCSSAKSSSGSSSSKSSGAVASAALGNAPRPSTTKTVQQGQASAPACIGALQLEDRSCMYLGMGSPNEQSSVKIGSPDTVPGTTAFGSTGVAAVLSSSEPVQAAGHSSVSENTLASDVARVRAASSKGEQVLPVQVSVDMSMGSASCSLAVPAEPVEAAPVTVKRPSLTDLTKRFSRSSSSNFSANAEETPSLPAAMAQSSTPFEVESQQIPESLDVTLLPVNTPDSYILTEEHLLPAAAPVPASWASGGRGGLGQRWHAPVVRDNQLKYSSCHGCAGGSASSSRSASFGSENNSDDSPPQTPHRSTRHATSSAAASWPPKIPVLFNKKSHGLPVSGAASTRTSRGSGMLSSRSSRPSPRMWNEPGAAPSRGVIIGGSGPEDDAGLWIPSDGTSNSRVSKPELVQERAAILDDTKPAMSTKMTCAWVAASAAAAVATISRLEETGDYCDGGPSLGSAVPGRPPSLGGPAPAAGEDEKRSALQVLAEQQLRVEDPQSPPAERSVPRTTLAQRKRVMSGSKPVGGGHPSHSHSSARLPAIHQARRSSRCKNTLFTQSLPVRTSAPSPTTNKALAPSAHQHDEAMLPARAPEPMQMQQQQQHVSTSLSTSMLPRHLDFAEHTAVCEFSVSASPNTCFQLCAATDAGPPALPPPNAKEDEDIALQQLSVGVQTGSFAQVGAPQQIPHMQILNDHQGAVLVPSGAPAVCLDVASPAAALGRLAEAKQKAMRLREQLGALSAYCDKLENAAGCFNKGSPSSLGPAHAAAMRAAADQLALASSPRQFAEEAVAPGLMAFADPLVEAQVGARHWSATAQSPSPARSPCTTGCGLRNFSFPAAPDEGAGPVSTAASPMHEHQEGLSKPPLSHWLADAVGNLFPEALNLFQVEEASHSGFRRVTCVPTAAW